MNVKTITIPPQQQSILLTVGIVTFFTLLGLYIYFLSMSVVQVVLRKEIIQEKRTIESQIAQLESKYIDAQHKVSDRIATLENFTATEEKIFVTRGETPTLVLSDTRP
jgi:hypothetical protein